MRYQILIGLNVLDSKKLSDFHASIKPLLATHDGEYCYDFNAPSALFSNRYKVINYVFALSFSSKEKTTEFLADNNYRKVRGRHVLKTFASDQIIFGYRKDPEESRLQV